MGSTGSSRRHARVARAGVIAGYEGAARGKRRPDPVRRRRRRGSPARCRSGRILIDGTRSGEVGDEVLRDRRHLAGDGLVVPVVAIDKQTGALEETPDMITRGFVLDARTEALLKEIRRCSAATSRRPASRSAPIRG